jgi:hypothetical protein
MKFVSIWKYDPATKTGPPSEAEMAAMGTLISDMLAAGVLVDTGGVSPTGLSMRVERSGAKTTVIDGPYAEAKEVVGGFALFNVASREEVLHWANRFTDCAGDGACELIEVSRFDQDD